LGRWSAIGVLLVLAAGCSRVDTESQPAQPEPPRIHVERQRVVSLTPSVTLLIQGLGRGDRLVGTSRYAGVEGVPVVADVRPHVEAILAADPDLVIAGRYPSLGPDIAGLRAQGLQVLDLPLDSLGDMRAAIQSLGHRLDARARAATLVRELDEALSHARRMAVRWADHPPKILLVFDVADGMVYTTGGGDHLAEILDVVGALNVAEGGPKTSRLSMEKVVSLGPDVIVHVAQSDRFADSAAAHHFWGRVARVPAVRNRQVHVWPDNSLATHGPSLPSAIRRFVSLVQRAVVP
jgi:ABC-type hemin transport system substrate-binding protein